MHADDISRRQFALYADSERGRYPVWQGLDLDGFMPGSGVVFATVTVAIALTTDFRPNPAKRVLRATTRNVSRPCPTLKCSPK